MKYFLCFHIFFFSLVSFGQNREMDSLITVLKDIKNLENKADLNLQISKLIENKNRDSSSVFAKNAEKIAIAIKNNDLLRKSFLQQGILFYKQKKDNIALDLFNKVDSLFEIEKVISEEYFMSKIYRAEISKFTFTMPGVLQAKVYLLQALQLAKEIKDEKLINLAEYRVGEWHGFMSQAESPKQHLDTASIYMEKALKYYQEQKDYEFIARVYSTMASINISQKDYKSAELNYTNRLNIIKESKDSTKIAEAYYGLGSVYRKFKQPDKGLKYLDSASVIFSKSGFSSDDIRKNLYRDYAYLYELKKDYKMAFMNMQKAIVYKDTLYEESNNKIAMELEAKYLNKEKQQEISLLKSQNELFEQQKTNQRNQLLGGLGFTSLAGLFFFFLYRNRQKTTKKLRELDKAKSNFFANISHEFRTPLTLISGPIQKQLQKESLPDDERDNFEMMHRNSTRLLSLVDQLLDISKIEAGSLKLRVTEKELIPFIGSLTDGFTYAAKQNEQKYTVNSNPSTKTTWFDKDVLEKIVTNLLSNAIKYTPTKGAIICDALVKENKFHFEVKNTGKGLSEEELTKVFERFYQLNENKQGVGIGLALVKELVHLHKGTITVESIPDEWTTFKVVLPINKEVFKEMEFFDRVAIKSTDEERINPEASGVTSEVNIVTDTSKDIDSHQDSDNPILLIVDDNADIRTYVSTIFKDTYTILTAKNGQEGIELAIEHIPDIIISDIMMPVKNGIELCNTVKVDERTSHVPIILLTAKAGEENKIEGIKTGADDYVTKPFNEELLKLRVQKLIENRKKLQERYSQEVILRPKDIAITSIDEQFLQRLQKVLDDKLVESSFSIENFSKAVGMSRMQLHRKLKALTGLSATEFIRSQRLKLAAQLLKKSEINVSQVGYSVGFNDHAYFSKCFREMYHCTPTEYANNSK